MPGKLCRSETFEAVECGGSFSAFGRDDCAAGIKKVQGLTNREDSTCTSRLQVFEPHAHTRALLIVSKVSGTGSYACQLAKNLFHAGKVITTVSTAKVSKVPELLGEGVVDESNTQKLYLLLLF